MTKRLLAVTLLLGLCQCMLAQAPSQRRNEIHITALGPGGIGSIGYSRTISRPESRLIRTQIGITTGMSIGSYEEDAWLLLLLLPQAHAQAQVLRPHHLHAELLGHTGFISVNYARGVHPLETRAFQPLIGLSLGLGLFGDEELIHPSLEVTPELGLIWFPHSQQHLETSVCLSVAYGLEDAGDTRLRANPNYRVGWRCTPRILPGFTLRAGLSSKWLHHVWRADDHFLPIFPYTGIGIMLGRKD